MQGPSPLKIKRWKGAAILESRSLVTATNVHNVHNVHSHKLHIPPYQAPALAGVVVPIKSGYRVVRQLDFVSERLKDDKLRTVTLGLVDILKVAGFDPTLPTKLVRHQDHRYPVEELRRHGWLELYQSYQGKPKFHGVKQIVSFYGLSGTRAGFFGVYKVLGYHSASEGRTLTQKWSEAQFFYDLERDPQFDDFRDRLIIDWGPGT